MIPKKKKKKKGSVGKTIRDKKKKKNLGSASSIGLVDRHSHQDKQFEKFCKH